VEITIQRVVDMLMCWYWLNAIVVYFWDWFGMVSNGLCA